MHDEKTETGGMPISDHDFPAEFYGIITQLMIFVKAMDEDYMRSKEGSGTDERNRL